MLMAEFSTAVTNDLPIKIILLNNGSLAKVKFEQREIGDAEYGRAQLTAGRVGRSRGRCGRKTRQNRRTQSLIVSTT
jgi:thiamine pyrophosphate-dependent acetolactate synthase large subunit-like protein